MKLKAVFGILLFVLLWACSSDPLARVAEKDRPFIAKALQRAGDNRHALLEFLKACNENELEGAVFLLRYMPERDLRSLTPEFLIENVKYAYQERKVVGWGKQIPDSIFLNYVLPYASLHERRDDWRKQFYEKFLALVKNQPSPGQAAVMLNNKIWDMIGVHYSTDRPKADQSPFESIEAGKASCTGLSILLVAACRAVCVPARFVGVPMWYDSSGNHSWVEVWDNGWHFIGAGEPGPLDQTWFEERAAHANKSSWQYRIYAVSYKHTGLKFPDLFDPTADYIYAVDVTDRYAHGTQQTNTVELRVKVLDKKSQQRTVAKVQLFKGSQLLASGQSRGEQNDLNDVLTFWVTPQQTLRLKVQRNGQTVAKQISIGQGKIQTVVIEME